jgi:hypothetical protein
MKAVIDQKPRPTHGFTRLNSSSKARNPSLFGRFIVT